MTTVASSYVRERFAAAICKAAAEQNEESSETSMHRHPHSKTETKV